MDKYRCQLCRARINPRGLSEKSIHAHNICIARKNLGRPTPKLKHCFFTKPARIKAQAHGIRELFKLSDALTRR